MQYSSDNIAKLNSFSIVINTDARRDALEKTLQSLSYIDYSNYEVIVVCGPTPDGSAELVERYRGAVKIGCCPERNLSMSRNIGIAMSAGDVVAFIDDDAFPEAEWLSDLAKGFDDDVVGGVGGRVYDHTGWSFQYGYAMADRLGNAWGQLTSPPNEYNFRTTDKYPYIQGTNASFKRSALLEIGGFDEEFAYYLDETDVCCRMVSNGYHLRQLPNAFVHHKFLPSHIRNANRVIKDKFQIIKNKLYFALVNNQSHHRPDAIIRDNCKFIDNHRAELIMHVDAGRASWDDVVRFDEDVDHAWMVGMTRGLSGERKLLRPSRAAALFQDFLPFPETRPIPERKVFCFISGEYAPVRVGGIGTYTQAAARGLASYGHHVHVLTKSADDGNTIDFENGVWVHRLAVRDINLRPKIELGVPDHIWNFSGTMRDELFRIQSRRHITCVEAPIWDVEGVAVVNEGIFPCVTSLHTTLKIWLESHSDRVADQMFMSNFGYPMLALEKYMLLNSDGVHANSRSIVETIHGYSGVANEIGNLQIIHHGVRDPGVDTRIGSTREARNKVNILFVGRLERRKGIDVLFEALDSLLPKHPSVSCDVVGDAEVPFDGDVHFGDVYAQRLAPHVNSGQLRIHGRTSVEALDKFYRNCDILIVPSRYESFGLTVIEGFAYGKAVIGARTGGIAEIVRADRTGLLFESENAEELQSILRPLLVNADERLRLQQAAREEFEATYSETRMAADMATFFQRFERKCIPIDAMTLSGEVRKGGTLRGEETGIILTPGTALEFDHDGTDLFFHFWRHSSSGIVRITCCGAVVEEWSLYSEAPDFKTFRAGDLSLGLVRIESVGRSVEAAKGSEVIFYGASARVAENSTRISDCRRALAGGGSARIGDDCIVRQSEMSFSDPNTAVLDLWNAETGILARAGHWIEFDALSSTLNLEFWGHPRSGVVELTIDGALIREIDLYSDQGGLSFVNCELPVVGRVRLTATGRKSEQAQGCEVIFYRARFLRSRGEPGIPVSSYFAPSKDMAGDAGQHAAARGNRSILEVRA